MEMHPDEYENWVRIKKVFEENGTTDSMFYQRACKIVNGEKDPLGEYLSVGKPSDEQSE